MADDGPRVRAASQTGTAVDDKNQCRNDEDMDLDDVRGFGSGLGSRAVSQTGINAGDES